MIAIPVIKTDQSNAAPTESQLKLAIAQVLSLPTAYNAPVIVLDFNIGDNGLVTGRFRDAARPRVFTYEIDDDGIAFKPFTPGRMDSLNIATWESFSKGYTYRLDAAITKSKSRPKCVKPTAYNCGKSCININKTCKVNPKDATSSMRRKKLKAVVDEYQKAKEGVAASGGAGVSKEAEEVAIKVGAKQVNIVGSPDLVPKITKKPFVVNDFDSIGKMTSLPIADIKATTEEDEVMVSKAVEALVASGGKNWVPIFVKEARDYEYEVIGNHVIHAAAKKLKLDRITAIVIDNSPDAVKQIELFTQKPNLKRKKEMEYDDFEEKFKELVTRETRKQELKGVVAIKTSNMIKEFEKEYSLPRHQIEQYFELLKSKKKIFAVKEKGEELFQWVE